MAAAKLVRASYQTYKMNYEEFNASYLVAFVIFKTYNNNIIIPK